jgi:glucan phosphoethanolaminetransferase (alkaline phosphatase superfamily)
MNTDRLLRGIAGFFILASLALAYFHSQYWLLFTAFVGLNLFQSSFTNWCPMMNILKALGFKSASQ